MIHNIVPDEPLFKYEVNEIFTPFAGAYFEAVGVKQNFPFKVEKLGLYTLKAYVRTGDLNSPTNYLNAQKFYLNGKELALTLDESTIQKVDNVFGGAHLGILKGEVSYTTEENTFTIESLRQWAGVVNFDDGVPTTGGLTIIGVPQVKYEADVKAAKQQGYNEGLAAGQANTDQKVKEAKEAGIAEGSEKQMLADQTTIDNIKFIRY